MLAMARCMWEYVQARWGRARSEEGASLAEYVLLVGFITVAIIALVVGFRTKLGEALQNAGDELSKFKSNP